MTAAHREQLDLGNQPFDVSDITDGAAVDQLLLDEFGGDERRYAIRRCALGHPPIHDEDFGKRLAGGCSFLGAANIRDHADRSDNRQR